MILVNVLRAVFLLVFGACTCIAAEQVELRGRVVCIPEEEKQPDLPANHEHVYGFKTTDHKTYKLIRTKYSEALFIDKRLHEKELLLKGKVSSDSKDFDVLRIRSIKDRVVHDLYYWCEICAIESVAPEICVCCQGPVELVEKPLPK
jgi:hypothetical protein